MRRTPALLQPRLTGSVPSRHVGPRAAAPRRHVKRRRAVATARPILCCAPAACACCYDTTHSPAHGGGLLPVASTLSSVLRHFRNRATAYPALQLRESGTAAARLGAGADPGALPCVTPRAALPHRPVALGITAAALRAPSRLVWLGRAYRLRPCVASRTDSPSGGRALYVGRIARHGKLVLTVFLVVWGRVTSYMTRVLPWSASRLASRDAGGSRTPTRRAPVKRANVLRGATWGVQTDLGPDAALHDRKRAVRVGGDPRAGRGGSDPTTRARMVGSNYGDTILTRE